MATDGVETPAHCGSSRHFAPALRIRSVAPQNERKSLRLFAMAIATAMALALPAPLAKAMCLL